MPGQPFGNAVGAGVDHPFVDIQLIQNVPNLPAQFLIDHIFNGVFRMGVQEGFQIRNAAGDGGEEGVLVYDPLIHRGRLEADQGLIPHILVVLLDIFGNIRQGIQGEDKGIFAFQIFLVFPGKVPAPSRSPMYLSA